MDYYFSLAGLLIATGALAVSFVALVTARRSNRFKMHDQESFETHKQLAETARRLAQHVPELRGDFDSQIAMSGMCRSLDPFRSSLDLSKHLKEMVERVFWEIAATQEDGPGAHRDITSALYEIDETALREQRGKVRRLSPLRQMSGTARRLREENTST